MPTYKPQKRTASPYSSLQRYTYSDMNQEPSTMDTSVYDFNEEDPKPYSPKKVIMFENFFNHGGTPYGKQEKSVKSVVSTSRKKRKLTAKKLPKKKSQQTKIAIEASSYRSSSASDSIELDNSDSESNQDRRKLEMRFGEMDTGAPGISCLITFRDEDQVAEQSREVVMHGEWLLFLEQCYSSPEFIFTADGIVLKVRSSGAVGAVKWALHEIESFRSYFDDEKGCAFIELNLTEHGVRTFLQALGRSDNYWSCHTLYSSLSINNSSWQENMKEITALCDGYRSLWRAGKEDMSKLFQQRVESIFMGRQDLENQHFLVDWIAYDRNRAMSDNWFDLIYPTKEDHDAVTVTQYDFLLLNPDQFLSDTIIDFYIKYLQSLLSEDENKRFYFYNSFFFRKLTEVDKNLQHGLEKRKSSFERVKRWTAKINIFEKDYLFIPIMQSAHWSLVIVCHPGSLSAGCQDECDSKAPMILHFDSLEGCHTHVEEPIQNYLLEAWNEMNGPSEDCENLSTLKFVAVKAPQQTNYSDCGLFLLHYVELFIKEVSNKDSIDFATDGWFNPAEASSKRVEIQSLIESLKAKDSCEKSEKSWFHTPSNVTGPPDGAWSTQRSGLLGEAYLKAANLFPGNMLDQGCSVLVSYPQQYQNNLPICAHTKFGHDHLELGLDLEQLLAAKELQQCFCHGQSQASIGKLSMHCLLQQGAVNHMQDIFMPSCTCVDKNCAVHDFDLASLHGSLEGTACNENLEDFQAVDREVAINLPGEFTEGLDNGASGFTLVEENCIFTKSGSFENNGVDAKALFGFSLHYDAKRVSDMAKSTVQKFSLDERPCAHAFQKGSESPNDDSLTEEVAKSNSEPNEGFLGTEFGDLEPKIWLTNSSGDFNHLEGKETNSAVNVCAEDEVLQSEDETYGGDFTLRESLTECTSRPEVSDNSSRLVEERTGLDRPLQVSSDGLTPNAAEGSTVGKRGRGSRRNKADQLTPATRRVTRSASKR